MPWENLINRGGHVASYPLPSRSPRGETHALCAIETMNSKPIKEAAKLFGQRRVLTERGSLTANSFKCSSGRTAYHSSRLVVRCLARHWRRLGRATRQGSAVRADLAHAAVPWQAALSTRMARVLLFFWASYEATHWEVVSGIVGKESGGGVLVLILWLGCGLVPPASPWWPSLGAQRQETQAASGSPKRVP